jgi:hypothetical protein
MTATAGCTADGVATVPGKAIRHRDFPQLAEYPSRSFIDFLSGTH